MQIIYGPNYEESTYFELLVENGSRSDKLNLTIMINEKENRIVRGLSSRNTWKTRSATTAPPPSGPTRPSRRPTPSSLSTQSLPLWSGCSSASSPRFPFLADSGHLDVVITAEEGGMADGCGEERELGVERS